MHGLLEPHRILALHLVALALAEPGEHGLHVGAQLRHLVLEFHVVEQHRREFLQLLALLGRHGVQHVLGGLHLARQLFHQLFERLRVLGEEVAELLHELLELLVLAVVVTLNHFVQRLHHFFHARHVLG